MIITDVYKKNYKQAINCSLYFRNNWGKRRVKTTSVHHATSPDPKPSHDLLSPPTDHQPLPFPPSQLDHGQCSACGLASHPFSSNPRPVCKPRNDYFIALLYGYLFFVSTRPQTSAHSLTSRNLHWSNHPLNQCYMPNLYHVIWQLHLFSLIVYLRLCLIQCYGITGLL